MERFVSDDGNTAVIRFDHGDRLLEGLQQVADELRLATAAIVTGYGALSRLHVHWAKYARRPAEPVFGVWEEPLEICCLTGLIADGQVHAHIAASNGAHTYGGHLEPGTVVCWLAEVVIQRLPLDLVRVKDEYGVLLLKSRELRDASRE